jgi:hypothetical protein
MPTLNDVLAGSQAQAVQVQQIIDALKGTPNKGVPVALVSLNDPNNYALTVQNDDPVNSRALSVLKADGTTLISADTTGVTLGAPLNVPAGALNGTQLANASVSNAKLGADVARANLLTNGGFEIWQRGNGPFVTSGVYAADRWIMGLSGTDALSTSRDTTHQDVGSAACAACVFTNANGGNTYFGQQIQLSDFPQLIGRTVSFSIRVSTTVGSAVRAGINNGTGFTYSSYHPGGGTYQTLSVPNVVMGSSGLMYFMVFFSTASCTAYVDNACLVIGSQPADYVPLHPADDLARCLRYYEILGEGLNEFLVVGYGGAGLADYRFYGFKARKAASPTVTKAGTWNVTNCAQPSASGGVSGATVNTTVTALGAFNYNNNAAGAYITAESNP